MLSFSHFSAYLFFSTPTFPYFHILPAFLLHQTNTAQIQRNTLFLFPDISLRDLGLFASVQQTAFKMWLWIKLFKRKTILLSTCRCVNLCAYVSMSWHTLRISMHTCLRVVLRVRFSLPAMCAPF